MPSTSTRTSRRISWRKSPANFTLSSNASIVHSNINEPCSEKEDILYASNAKYSKTSGLPSDELKPGLGLGKLSSAPTCYPARTLQYLIRKPATDLEARIGSLPMGGLDAYDTKDTFLGIAAQLSSVSTGFAATATAFCRRFRVIVRWRRYFVAARRSCRWTPVIWAQIVADHRVAVFAWMPVACVRFSIWGCLCHDSVSSMPVGCLEYCTTGDSCSSGSLWMA